MPKAWKSREHDRAVARVLVDLAPALLALFAELVDGLVDHAHELQDDRCSTTYGMMPSAKIERFSSAPPENMLKKPSRPPDCLATTARMTLRSTPGVGDEHADAVDREHPQREEQRAGAPGPC